MNESKKYLAYDLFLLMLNLSQLEGQECILSVFLEAMNSIQTGVHLRLLSPGERAPFAQRPSDEVIEIATAQNSFGQIALEDRIDEQPDELIAFVRNAVRMLAFILERRLGEELLAEENLRLEEGIRERTAELLQANEQLESEIAERKRVEGQLRESEEKYKSIFELAPEGIMTLSLKGVVTSCNPAFLRLTGFSREEIVGKHFSKLPTLRLRDIPGYIKLFGSFIQEKVPGPVEFVWIRKDGATRWGKAHASLMKEGPKVTGVQAIVADITEQKRAVQLLQALNQAALAMEKALTPEEIFSAVVGEFKQLGFSCAIYLTDESQSQLFPEYLSYGAKMVEAAEKLVGLKAGEFSIPVEIVDVYRKVVWERQTVFVEDAKEFMEEALPEPMKKFARQIARVFKTPKSIDAPLIVEDEVIGLLSVQSDDLSEGDMPAIAAFAHQIAAAWHRAQLFEQAQLEIVERKRAEEALRESEEKYRLLVENANEAIVVAQDGRLRFSNPKALEITDYSHSELASMPFAELIHPDDREVVVGRHLRRLQGEQFRDAYSFRIIDKGGNVKWLEIRAVLIEWEGRPATLNFLSDVTKRERLLTALIHRSNQLQTAAQVSKSASTLLDPQELMNQAVNLIRDRFNFYYVGLFLVDKTGEYAILRAGTGEAGRQMLEAGYRLAIDGGSMVGWCVARAQARVVLNAGQEAARFENPFLPGMRSEMVLPLISRGQCLGALTVQSAQEAAFSEDDVDFQSVAILQTMADQLAIAIENARLFQQLVDQLDTSRQLNAEISRLQRLLQNVADSMPSALIALDTEGRVLTWNPVAEALTGRSATQVRGQSLWQTCPELARYRDLYEQVLREGQVAHRRKEQLVTGTGTVYHDVSVFPLKASGISLITSSQADSAEPAMSPKGSPQVEGTVLRIDDVTQRVQLEEMMLQSAKMASVGGLAAGVAHEINNPLAAMMQSAQMVQMAFDAQRPRTRERLLECGVDPERLECYLQQRGLMDYLDGIRTTGGRAARIVSDLLTFSRQASFQARPHDLNVLVEQTLELAVADYDLKKKYDFRDIEIVREFAPDLPKVVCDGQQIQQVVLNLVRNAAQVMAGEIERGDRDRDREYHPRLTLRTTYREEIRDPKSEIRDRMVWLEVEDNGPGIPEAVQARLFEPFFTTKDVGQGTGLGLWLCWSIVVERHGGRIWAERGAEGGSRFVVELPVI